MKKINRILIDCSETYNNDLNTGIQRVVRNIVERSERMSKKLNVPVIPIVLDVKGYVSLKTFLNKKNNINSDVNEVSDVNDVNNYYNNKSKVKINLKDKVKIIINERLNIDKTKNIYKVLKVIWQQLERLKYFFISLRQMSNPLWRLLKRLKYFVMDFTQMSNPFIINDDIIFPEENDILLLIDSFWNYYYNNNYFKFFCKNIKKKNGVIIVVVYDIIALTNPEFFEKDLTLRFRKALNKFIKLSDGILTISKSEMKIIKEYFNNSLNNDNNNLYNNTFQIKKKPISFFYLGYDFKNKIGCIQNTVQYSNNSNSYNTDVNAAANNINSNSYNTDTNKNTAAANNYADADANNNNSIREDLFQLADSVKQLNKIHKTDLTSLISRIYLTVGTIEPRKGYDYVFEAFEDLWKNGFGGVLVIVGKIGWNVDTLIKKFNNSVYLNKKLFIFNNLNDDELNFLYSSADAVICASLREGFGLPLVEAMYHNIPVLASDISVFREVGADYSVYFTPDEKGLIKAINEFEYKNNIKPNMKNIKNNCYNWDCSVDMLADRIKELILNL